MEIAVFRKLSQKLELSSLYDRMKSNNDDYNNDDNYEV